MSENESSEVQFSKEDYLFLAKIYLKCESFEQMLSCMKNIISLNQTLTTEERNYFSSANKNFLSEKRQKLKAINSLLKKHLKNSSNTEKESTKITLLKELKSNFEKEILQINMELQSIIDEYLIPNTHNNEDIVFYTKMKADYYRYMIELNIESPEDENYLALAEEYYKSAYESAKKHLNELNFVRLSTSLNYAIFIGDCKKNKDEAIEIAKTAFESALQNQEGIEIDKNKESLLIVQLIQENLILWTGGNIELVEEEVEEPEVMNN